MSNFINKAVCQILDKIEEENPIHQITEREIDEIFLKVGSLLTIIKNKNISPTTLFINILNEPVYEQLINKLIGTNSLLEISKLLIVRHPNLLKSKVVKGVATKIIRKRKKKQNAGSNNRVR